MKYNKPSQPERMEPRTFETTVERRRAENEILTLEEGPTLSIQQDGDSFNPYDRRPAARCEEKKPAKKTDLRKLSEWIKAMRAAEEAKKSR